MDLDPVSPLGVLLFGMGFLGESIEALNRRLDREQSRTGHPRSD